jgi:voltage-gated potassium channel
LDTRRALLRAFILIVFILAVGTFGYRALEGWSLLESLYMTVITITTIGFEEVHDLGPAGEAFTILIIILGMGTTAFLLLTATRFVVEGEVSKILSRRRYMKTVERLKDHFIICGYGRMGSFVCNQLREQDVPFVVIEHRPDVQDALVHAGYLLVPGDATKEQTLIAAGINSARGLVALLDSDAGNVYVVLTARRLNPELDIIARAGEQEAEEKLQWAGATRVISPYAIGGRRLVLGILKPKVMGFVELALDYKELDIDLEEVEIAESSPYCGQRLMETGIRRDLNLIIVSIMKHDGRKVFNPGPDTMIEAKDTLIAMGERNSLKTLETKAGSA